MSTYNTADQAALSPDRIAAALTPFGIVLSSEQIEKIREYALLLLKWNRAINLTAIEDPTELVTRHFGESIFAASFLKIGTDRLVDVGTGPGFPGLPLNIVCPEMDLTLIESNSKKCAFLVEAAQALGLANVNVVHRRYEEFPGAGFDLVCSRAVGGYEIQLPWARRALRAGGRVVLWLGTEESIRLGRKGEFRWEVPAPIPESRKRVILVGHKDS
jgi:16S rRNA (guanine527-N7)-methyltransferase